MDGNRRITVRIPIPSALEEGRRITVRLVRGLQEARQIHELNTFERTLELCDHSDPFSMPESDFAMNFSLPKLLARMLIREMSPFLSKSDIPPHIKVLCALQFFSNGPVKNLEEQYFDFGLPLPSMTCCIEEVIRVMNIHLLRKHIRFPCSRAERDALILKNFKATSLNGVLGFVDTTHVIIRAPSKDACEYVNRHGTHSLKCQIACDSDLIIFNTSARFPGETVDSWVWSSCALRANMAQIFKGGQRCWLLGDSAYPHEPWLHVPLVPTHAQPNGQERRYNDLHCSARSSVEECIAVLKGRFLCLSRLDKLEYTPVQARHTVNACSILHNMCVRAGLPNPQLFHDSLDLHDPENDAISDDDSDDDMDIDEAIALNIEGETVRQQDLIAPCNPAGAGEE